MALSSREKSVVSLFPRQYYRGSSSIRAFITFPDSMSLANSPCILKFTEKRPLEPERSTCANFAAELEAAPTHSTRTTRFVDLSLNNTFIHYNTPFGEVKRGKMNVLLWRKTKSALRLFCGHVVLSTKFYQ